MLDIAKLYTKQTIPHYTGTDGVAVTCPFCKPKNKEPGMLTFFFGTEQFVCDYCGPHSFWKVMAAILHISDREELGRVVAKYQRKR
jgi:hypothetical protein